MLFQYFDTTYAYICKRLLVDWAGSSVLRFWFLSERNGLMRPFSIHWTHAMCQHLFWVLVGRAEGGTLTNMNNRSRRDLGSVRRDRFEDTWARSKSKAWCTPPFHVLIQHLLIEHLLCARHTGDKTALSPAPMESEVWGTGGSRR